MTGQMIKLNVHPSPSLISLDVCVMLPWVTSLSRMTRTPMPCESIIVTQGTFKDGTVPSILFLKEIVYLLPSYIRKLLKKYIFLIWSILKSLLKLQYRFCSSFWYFAHKACGILLTQPEIKCTPSALQGKVLTPGPPGKSLNKAC